MFSVYATLLPSGRIELPAALAQDKPVPVLVTILEPLPEEVSVVAAHGHTGKGDVTATLALLRSPEFLALPKSDPAEVAQRIQDLRNDWNDE